MRIELAAMKRKHEEKERQNLHKITHIKLLETVSCGFRGIAAKLPKLDSLKRTIQRQRQRVLAAPAQPLNLLELEIPMEYRSTAKGDIFLLYDSGPSPERILTFGTFKMLICANQFTTLVSRWNI